MSIFLFYRMSILLLSTGLFFKVKSSDELQECIWSRWKCSLSDWLLWVEQLPPKFSELSENFLPTLILSIFIFSLFNYKPFFLSQNLNLLLLSIYYNKYINIINIFMYPHTSIIRLLYLHQNKVIIFTSEFTFTLTYKYYNTLIYIFQYLYLCEKKEKE